jgi:hypothetical protein
LGCKHPLRIALSWTKKTALSHNNKTDSLITTEYVGKLIAFSQSNNFSVYFDFDNTVGEGLILSYWRGGTKGAVPKDREQSVQ